jgi:hypothetical protein
MTLSEKKITNLDFESTSKQKDRRLFYDTLQIFAQSIRGNTQLFYIESNNIKINYRPTSQCGVDCSYVTD